MDDVLLLSLTMSLFGLIAVVLNQVFKSKWTDTSVCCGLLTVHRNVEIEQAEHVFDVEHGISTTIQPRSEIDIIPPSVH